MSPIPPAGERTRDGMTESFQIPDDTSLRAQARANVSLARALVRDAHTAEDVAQDAFLAAYRGLGQLKDGERFGSWLKGITCRTAANWLRRNGDRINNETPLPHRKTLVLEDARPGPAGHAERQEVGERIQRAVDALPERYRLIVILRYLQELSYAEIAEFTGESKGEIRGVLQKAGRKLRDLLSEWDSSSEGEGRWRPVRK